MDLAGKVYENPKKYNRCRTGSSVFPWHRCYRHDRGKGKRGRVGVCLIKENITEVLKKFLAD